MLYFSHRPIDPESIDLSQHGRLRVFKAETLKKALMGRFSDVAELRQSVIRDLTRQVRDLRKHGSSSRQSEKLEEEFKITDLFRLHRRHKIPADQYRIFVRKFLG
jgi:hypothetical protein